MTGSIPNTRDKELAWDMLGNQQIDESLMGKEEGYLIYFSVHKKNA